MRVAGVNPSPVPQLRGARRARWGACLVALATLAVAAIGVAQEPNPKAPAPPVPLMPPPAPAAAGLRPGPASAPQGIPAIQVRVESIHIAGLRPGGPTQAQLLQQPVTLVLNDGVWSAAKAGQGLTVKLQDIGGLGEGRVLDASAIQAVVIAASNAFIHQGLAATRITLTSGALEHLLAPHSDGVLTLTATEARVAEVRTQLVKNGKVVGDASGVYPTVAINSPVRPGGLVWLHDIDQYIYRANRQPGRQVDVALAPGPNPGEVDLDYLVTAQKAWTAYFEINNTGTPQTSDWRERFGFADFNLTGADDILAVDYLTAGFNQVHAVSASYDRPLPQMPTLRAKLYGSYSSYTASDVGLSGAGFTGDSTGIGGELAWNFFQRDALFLDLAGGVQYRNIHTRNDLVHTDGNADFVLPYVGLRLDDRTFTTSTLGSATLEVGSVSGNPSEADLSALGRTAVDRTWVTLHYDLSHSFYLEPLLDPDFGKPGQPSTLAHELYFDVRGQYTPSARLVPNFTQAIGGFYTVRGYPESFAIGDSGFIETAEYRFHLPRLFAPAPAGQLFGQPFHFAPAQPLARPDWDLLLRAFIDVGQTVTNDAFSYEKDVNPIGAGVGAELSLWKNVDLRVDWGVALTTCDTGAGTVTAGSSRVHISCVFLY